MDPLIINKVQSHRKNKSVLIKITTLKLIQSQVNLKNVIAQPKLKAFLKFKNNIKLI